MGLAGQPLSMPQVSSEGPALCWVLGGNYTYELGTAGQKTLWFYVQNTVHMIDRLTALPSGRRARRAGGIEGGEVAVGTRWDLNL